MAEVFIQCIEGIDTEKIKDMLSAKRIEKIERCRNKNAALLSAAAELALIKAVKSRFPDAGIPIEYDYGKNGKPYLTGLDAGISLSHSGKLAVCAIADGAVGADIQRIGNVNMKIADRYFSEGERAYIDCAEDKKRAFFEIWVRKEARVKLTGQGIGSGFTDIDADAGGEYEYTMHSLDDRNYLLCTCERKMYKNS